MMTCVHMTHLDRLSKLDYSIAESVAASKMAGLEPSRRELSENAFLDYGIPILFGMESSLQKRSVGTVWYLTYVRERLQVALILPSYYVLRAGCCDSLGSNRDDLPPGVCR
ncbi:unnamed protein product [Ectocarpus sp. 8 AP-2014]